MKYPELEEMKTKIEKIVELAKSKTLTITDIEQLVNYILESDENYFKFIVTVDAASRTADAFMVMTTLHQKLKNNIGSKYTKKYHELSNLNSPLAKAFTEWQTKYIDRNWFHSTTYDLKMIEWLFDFIENSDSELFNQAKKDESSKS